MIDKKILHYKILEKLGEGGMGVVYLAEDTKLERRVAIKFLPRHIAGNSNERKRFEIEAKAAAALNHPNITTIYAIEHTDDDVFIVMEYIQGQTLQGKISADWPLPVADCIDIAIQIARGLMAAHEKGIIHRDIKSTNIMITEKGDVKIMDFGLAKFRGSAQLTKEGTTVGTAAYMSPEQARGEDTDQKADIWSFGVVLYELLTGKLPFKGDYEQAVIYSILNETPKLDAYQDDTPESLKHMVEKSLKRNPEDRYDHAGEIFNELKQLTGSTQNIIITQPSEKKVRTGFMNPKTISAAAVLIIILSISGYRMHTQNLALTHAREVLLPEIEKLADDMPWTGEGLQSWHAYELANQAKVYLSGDPHFEKVQDKYSLYNRFTTDPPGTDVYIKPYGNPDSAWQYLGKTPIDSIRLPISLLRIKFEKPGFRTLEDIIWIWVSQRAYDYPMTPENEIPAGMVKVHGSEKLGDFLIDRFEVTNREYKNFIEQGGYQKKEYWKQKFIKNGKSLSWEQAIDLFKDKTGITGPATWEVGDYPKGQDNFPVSGISWYEAAAYAEFAGKSLPTYQHWRYTAATFHQAEIVPLSNLNGTGRSAVGSSGSMNRFGTYDMAGNVSEWCWNKIAGAEKRFLLGGGWKDPDYLFGDNFAQQPFDRLPTNGFRCMKLLPVSKSTEDIFEAVKRETRDFKVEKPVPEDRFRDIKRMYTYAKLPLNAKIQEVDDSSDEWIKQTVTVDAVYNDEQMTIFLFLPKNTRPPYQAVIYFPGSGSKETISSKNLRDFRQIDFFPKSGRAVIYPVYKGTYERYTRENTWKFPALQRDLMIKQVQDFQRVVDYLISRDDIEKDKLCYFGFSMGGYMGPLILGIEDRLKTGVLYVAGLSQHKFLPEVDPLNFAPRVKMPVLMLNGRYDDVVPLEASQRPLYELLGTAPEHKKWLVYENGHSVPREDLIRETLGWLDKYLGPVQK